MYFVEDRSQDDVAAILGTTRSNVSRMLKQARDLGIVEIRIVDPAKRDHELELALRDRFGLVDVRVLEVTPETDVLSGVGRLAVRWLDETLRDGQVVALSWGQTLQAVVRGVDGLPDATSRSSSSSVVCRRLTPPSRGKSSCGSSPSAWEPVTAICTRLRCSAQPRRSQ